MRRIFELTRDWRIRTIVPVVIVNILAFAGLYAMMYRFAIRNLEQAHGAAAEMLFDDLRLYYEDSSAEHRVMSMAPRMQRLAKTHGLLELTLYAMNGDPVIDVSGTVANVDRGNRLIFERSLGNTRSCHSCHDPRMPSLGVMQITFDVTQAIASARANVQRKFALAGVAWVGILVLLFWTVRVVIGRPIARIESSIQPEIRHDLDGLARAHRQREETIARKMVRAEQLAALGEVAAGLTHEIKNPLAGVIAALELLRSEANEPGISALLDQMSGELRRVTGTLDSLLRLARPRPPHRTEVDLARVVREVTSLFEARLRRQGIELIVDIGDDIPILSLDSGLMVQLLVNLLTNSMQATDRGGVVRVELTKSGSVALAVSDTGGGIAAADLERIFVPFFTTKEEGTGLGLAICRQIVEQHGGEIEVQSEVGRGTTVLVWLPDEEGAAHGALAAG